jgi:hypothetical protein
VADLFSALHAVSVIGQFPRSCGRNDTNHPSGSALRLVHGNALCRGAIAQYCTA